MSGIIWCKIVWTWSWIYMMIPSRQLIIMLIKSYISHYFLATLLRSWLLTRNISMIKHSCLYPPRFMNKCKISFRRFCSRTKIHNCFNTNSNLTLKYLSKKTSQMIKLLQRERDQAKCSKNKNKSMKLNLR
jgi:hypothetical protein